MSVPFVPRARGELSSGELLDLAHASEADLLALEAELAEATGWREVVLVPSARVGVVLALRALGVPAGAEVIVSALGFAPIVERMRVRWTPRPVDVRGTSLCPERTAAAVGPRTGAVVATHAFGRPAPIAAYRCAAPGVPIVEDAAQALGARADARGDAAVFSFGPTKPLAAWGGGAVACDSAALAARLRALRAPAPGRTTRLARAACFELATRVGGPVLRSPLAAPWIERWLCDPAGATRWRPWQDAPFGPMEARLVRRRLRALDARTRARRSAHAASRAALLAEGLDAWPDAPGGIGYGVLVTHDDALRLARALRRRGIDAPAGELRDVSNGACPEAARLERTLLRVPV